MDAAAAVDAQTAPTAAWKTTEQLFTSAHRPLFFIILKIQKPPRPRSRTHSQCMVAPSQMLVLGARIVRQFGDPSLARASHAILGKVAAIVRKISRRSWPRRGCSCRRRSAREHPPPH
jgi:hypothetical protein